MNAVKFKEIGNAIDFKIWNAKKERDGLLVGSLLFIWTGILPLICLGMAYMQHATMKKYEVCKQEWKQDSPYIQQLEQFQDTLLGLKDPSLWKENETFELNDAPIIIYYCLKKDNSEREIREKIKNSKKSYSYYLHSLENYQREQMSSSAAASIKGDLDQSVEGQPAKIWDEKLNIHDGSCKVSFAAVDRAIDFQISKIKKNIPVLWIFLPVSLFPLAHYYRELNKYEICKKELKKNLEYQKFIAAFAAQNTGQMKFVYGLDDPRHWKFCNDHHHPPGCIGDPMEICFSLNEAPLVIYDLYKKYEHLSPEQQIEELKKAAFDLTEDLQLREYTNWTAKSYQMDILAAERGEGVAIEGEANHHAK